MSTNRSLELLNRIDQLLGKNRKYHDTTQLVAFVLQKESQGCLFGLRKQAIRELNSRVDAVRRLKDEQTELHIDIDELEQELVSIPSEGFRARRSRLELSKKNRQLDSIISSIGEQMRELKVFFAYANAADNALSDLSEEELVKLEKEYWSSVVSNAAALELSTVGRPSASILELADCLKAVGIPVSSIPEKALGITKRLDLPAVETDSFSELDPSHLVNSHQLLLDFDGSADSSPGDSSPAATTIQDCHPISIDKDGRPKVFLHRSRH